MELNEYQAEATETATYPGRFNVGGIVYTALGLAGEAGEIANKVKKIVRDDNGILTEERRLDLLKEAGDTLWYLALVVDELGGKLADIGQANIDKLADRAERGVLTGAGDNR